MTLTEKMIKEAQEASDKLYNSDLVYKTLVDNYCKTSALNIKGKASNEEVSKSLNALAKYKEKLANDNALEFIKKLNLTNEDIRDMLVQGIISSQTMIDILKFKGWIKN